MTHAPWFVPRFPASNFARQEMIRRGTGCTVAGILGRGSCDMNHDKEEKTDVTQSMASHCWHHSSIDRACHHYIDRDGLRPGPSGVQRHEHRYEARDG